MALPLVPVTSNKVQGDSEAQLGVSLSHRRPATEFPIRRFSTARITSPTEDSQAPLRLTTALLRSAAHHRARDSNSPHSVDGMDQEGTM